MCIFVDSGLHNEYSDHKLQIGDIVVVDIRGTYAPVCHSDLTRTYSIGDTNRDVV